MDIIQKALQVRPDKRQLAWQNIEFFGFIHFGMNTMTDSEWGTGQEKPEQFNPKDLDCLQWVKALKAAGMKAAILTCKHHDGFCLWPSQYTKHSVKFSPWKNGRGDVVAEFSKACQMEGLKFGIYLSPWDRAEAVYGQGKAYDDYFVNQLEELLTNYGEVFEVWFDGANGEGPNGKVQKYDWKRYYDTIQRLQPNAVIAISGPDVRWVGNEAGHTRINEWSVVPAPYANPNYTAEFSQQEDDAQFSKKFNQTEDDLASREKLLNYNGELIWFPAEVDTSIRPGWFYHSAQDHQIKNSEELFDIYIRSVGGNCALILNVPPNKDGKIHEKDVAVLQTLGEKIDKLKSIRLPSQTRVFQHLNGLIEIPMEAISPDSEQSFWTPLGEDYGKELILSFAQPTLVNTLFLQEYIALGQRIEKVEIYALENEEENWKKLCEVGTIGYQKIVQVELIKVKKIRFVFTEYRGDKFFIKTINAGYLN